MKNVYSRSGEVAHIWAHKRNPKARTGLISRRDGGHGSQVFQSDDGLLYYSYGTHYVIAAHLPDGSVAINLESNSSTTNGHVSEAVQATRHLKQYKVFNPGSTPDQPRTQHWIDHLLEEAAKAKPDGKRPYWLAQAVKVADDFNAVAKIMGLSTTVSAATTPEDLERMRKEAQIQAKLEREREKAWEIERRKSEAERIAEWRAGLRGSCPSGVGTLLRVNKNNPYIDTSHGAEIPIEHAKRLWPVILRVMRGQLDTNMAQPLGSYHLNLIRADGSIVVDCHDIPFSEIEGIAVQLGLVSLASEEA